MCVLFFLRRFGRSFSMVCIRLTSRLEVVDLLCCTWVCVGGFIAITSGGNKSAARPKIDEMPDDWPLLRSEI